MHIETLRDVLKWTQKFHHELSECMQSCSEKNISQRSQLLLEYLSKHEARLEKVIESFSKSADTRALNTWCIEYLEKHPIIQHENCNTPFASLDSRTITEIIMVQHEQVVALYKYLRSRAEVSSTIELLQQLVDVEENTIMQMAVGTNLIEDM
jgi:hypothetical protein